MDACLTTSLKSQFMKKSKKEFIKKKIFQVLHFIGYVSSVILILLCVIAGLKSCNSQNNNNNQSLQNNALNLPVLNNSGAFLDIKYNYYEDSFIVNYGDLLAVYDFYGLDYNKDDYDDDYTLTLSFDIELFNDSFDYVYENELTTLEVLFSVYSNQQGDYLRIDSVYINGDLTQEKDTPDPFNLTYFQYGAGYDYDFIYQGDYNPLVSLFYNWHEWNYFTFNNQINFMYPFGMTLSNFTGDYASGMIEVLPNTLQRVKYSTGLFYSNGEYFNEIWYDLQPGWSTTYDYNTNSNVLDIRNGPQNSWSYYCMIYNNTLTGSNKIVNMRDSQSYELNGGYGQYLLQSSTWLNDNYRYISYCSMPKETLTKLQGFNNNNANFSTGNISGSGSDVFSLLTYAFTALVPFFSVMILPGISMGVLIFTPLVVVVLFAIMRIIKK